MGTVAKTYWEFTPHYGIIAWRLDPSAPAHAPVFRGPAGACRDQALFHSYTHAKSCAQLQSLVTGYDYEVRDEHLQGNEHYDTGTHHSNHRVVFSGRRLTPDSRHILQGIFHEGPPPSTLQYVWDLVQRTTARMIVERPGLLRPLTFMPIFFGPVR